MKSLVVVPIGTYWLIILFFFYGLDDTIVLAKYDEEKQRSYCSDFVDFVSQRRGKIIGLHG